jgi:AraC-like DNA-binding protein
MDGIVGTAISDGEEELLTPQALFQLDYLAPDPALAPFVTTFYHFRCDETEIRDVQPAAVGHVLVFLRGEGDMLFEGGRKDRSSLVSLLTPCSRAAPIEVDGPFHCIGAALSPLGWAALTGLHAGEWADRLLPAKGVLGDGIDQLGQQLRADYLDGRRTGDALCGDLAAFLVPLLKPVNPRHVALIRRVADWLGTSLNPEIDALVEGSGYSARQIQRLCERYYGLPPLRLVRKYRALRVVALLGQPDLPDEDVAALVDHFYDQSHMIREIRTFAGRTPGRLIGDDSSILNALLDVRNFREISPQVAPMPGLAREDRDA